MLIYNEAYAFTWDKWFVRINQQKITCGCYKNKLDFCDKDRKKILSSHFIIWYLAKWQYKITLHSWLWFSLLYVWSYYLFYITYFFFSISAKFLPAYQQESIQSCLICVFACLEYSVYDRRNNGLAAWMKTRIEPPHEKTNKMTVCPAKIQISLGIHPVWSESSLSTWRKIGSSATHWAQAKTDQTGWMPMLIWVFAGCTCHFVGFVMLWLNLFDYEAGLCMLVTKSVVNPGFRNNCKKVRL